MLQVWTIFEGKWLNDVRKLCDTIVVYFNQQMHACASVRMVENALKNFENEYLMILEHFLSVSTM